jgi:hypothetical protein
MVGLILVALFIVVVLIMVAFAYSKPGPDQNRGPRTGFPKPR